MKKNRRILYWLLVIICVLVVIPVSAQDENNNLMTNTVLPVENPDAIDDIQEPGANGEIGLAYINYNTTVGTYESCSTDAFFYLLFINESDEGATITMPRKAKITENYYYIDDSAYTCKDVPITTWTQDNYADANGGTACVLNDNILTLPAKSALSVRGKIVNFSHEITRENNTDYFPDDLLYQLDVQINNKRKNAAGALYEEGGICKALEFLEVSENNRIEGGYFIDPTGQKSCSMNYFFIVENTDLMYSNVVELPRWIDLNENRWDIGCSYIYEDCKISGFRHYAWAVIDDDSTYKDLDYHFCDQDRADGDNCYEENTLWWLRIPPKTKIAVRGMVNDLCGDAATYPFFENYVHASFEISDAGSNKWWVDGEIAGTEIAAAASSMDSNSGEYSQISDRDPDEEITRYIFEDPSLVKVDSSGNISAPDSAVSDSQGVSAPAQTTNPSNNDQWWRIGQEPCSNFFCDDFRLPPTGFPANRITTLAPQPAEITYQDLGNYQIEIPAFDITSSIVGVPRVEDSWEVQWLGDKTGLLEGSDLPGEGLTVVAAHNHIDSGKAGPFAFLSELAENDRVFVRKPGGELLQYAVSENLLLEPDNFAAVGNIVSDDSLVLITCENESTEGGYLNRRVVVANPV